MGLRQDAHRGHQPSWWSGSSEANSSFRPHDSPHSCVRNVVDKGPAAKVGGAPPPGPEAFCSSPARAEAPRPRCTRGLPGASCTPAQRRQNLWDRGLGVSIALGSRRASPMRSGALQFCSAVGLSHTRRGSSEGLSHLPKVTQLKVMGPESPFVSLLGRTPCPP